MEVNPCNHEFSILHVESGKSVDWCYKCGSVVIYLGTQEPFTVFHFEVGRKKALKIK